MKKTLALALAFALLLSLSVPALAFDAVRSPQTLIVDGETIECDKYNIDGNNYFKLRDLAYILNGTESEFDVGWDDATRIVSITTNHAYAERNGHEMEIGADLSGTAVVSPQTIMIDGEIRSDLSVYNIGGSNFFQLRELGEALGFAVDYDEDSDTAIVMSKNAVLVDPSVLPAVGDVVDGFTVTEIREFPLVGATIVVFEHNRTGAQLVYIANSDTDRAFDLTFHTRAIDNTGLPHVFEHSTLDGSEMYPSKALFFNLIYQTYNTYMNAMTGALYTTYPVASLSEAQLLKYADYYTDSCLHPLILTDESIFREEAWRYRMASMDDDLTIEGTVYSEMLGALDLSGTAYNNLFRTAFPGSTIGNESGGEPEHIPEMTWESLRSYHDLYYHPSNCTAFLYGEFEDYTAFLKLLNRAFAPYEKKEFTFEDADYTPLTGSVTADIPFPVEAGSNTENASTIYYAFICPGLKDDPQEEMVLNTLTDLLVPDSSPLMQQLKRALPSGQFATYIELDGPEDMIVFYAANVNPSDAETFRTTVNAALEELAGTGFSDALLDGLAASLALDTKLIGEGSSLGVSLITTMASYYASTGLLFGYQDYVDALEQLKDWNEQGLYTKAISDWLLNCDVTVLATTYPEPGAREALDAAEAERLAAVKASMSEEELQAIIDMTNAEDDADDATAYVIKLQAVTVSSLPEEVRSYEISDRTGDDGVRYIDAAADVDGVGSTVLMFDASALPQEDIHWFALYTALLGEMDTAQHSKEELALLWDRYMYDGTIRLSIATDAEDGLLYPRLRVGWTAADEDLAAGYDLAYEILYDTEFSNAELLQGQISQLKASLKSSITGTPYSTMLYRAMGAVNPLYRYYSYFNGIEFYSFLEQVELLAQEDPAAVAGKLAEIADYFCNRTGATALFAGSEESIAANAALSAAFMAKLDARDTERAEYSFDPIAPSEALIVDSTVQYNGIVADFATLGMDGYNGALDALANIVADAYLYPMLRDQYGAYGAWAGFMNDYGAYVLSYRDPNVAETYAVYEGLPAFLADLELTQDDLDGYILSSYVGYAAGSGELSGALSAALDAMTHEPEGGALEAMRALKALTPETLKEYAAAYESMMESGCRFSAGGASAINANAELFDVILNPFGAVDASEVEFEDVPEGSEHYDAVRFVFEQMVMSPAEDARFGVDEAATVGDLAGALYGMIGGDISAQEEALAFYAGYGVLAPDAAVSDELTGAETDAALAIFSQLIEVEYESDPDASAEALTRGELAEILTAYLVALG